MIISINDKDYLWNTCASKRSGQVVSLKFYRFATGFEKPKCFKFTNRILERFSGLVWEPWHYKYSSAIDYYTNEHGLLKIEHLGS